MMNNFSVYELLWLFFIYSFLGWLFETTYAALRQKHFVNRGLVSGPLCIVYGIGAVLMTVGLQELTGVWLFIFATVYAAATEFAAGKIIERVYHERWWNYSNIKWNLDGYICVPFSLIKGALGFVVVRFGNRLLLNLVNRLPQLLVHIVLIVFIAMLCVDVIASYILAKGKSRHPERWEEANDAIASVGLRMARAIDRGMQRRIHKAYPKAAKVETALRDKTVFAQGCDFYKVVMLFFIGAFLGDITETIFCRITAGVWMSRSSVVWGPFSIVWGLAIAAATSMLYKYRNKSDGFLFMVGTLLGGAYEYLCSVFTEIVFGKVFWDYSKIPFNLGGRINLLYCFFWGIAAVVWFKLIYPKISALIEKIPVLAGKIATWLLIVFMLCNMVVSGLALIRYDEREKGVEATAKWQVWMDEHYDDAVMEKIYPNAKTVK